MTRHSHSACTCQALLSQIGRCLSLQPRAPAAIDIDQTKFGSRKSLPSRPFALAHSKDGQNVASKHGSCDRAAPGEVMILLPEQLYPDFIPSCRLRDRTASLPTPGSHLGK